MALLRVPPSVVPGLFFGRAGPAPQAGAGKFLRAGARTRAEADLFRSGRGPGPGRSQKMIFSASRLVCNTVLS